MNASAAILVAYLDALQCFSEGWTQYVFAIIAQPSRISNVQMTFCKVYYVPDCILIHNT